MKKAVFAVFSFLLVSVWGQDVSGVDPSSASKEGGDAAQKKAATMTERITAAELAQRKAAASNANTMAHPKFKPVEDDSSHAVSKPDLYANSEVITDGTSHTILPKGCILGYTEALANRVVDKATGAFEFWPEFYQKNKDWLKLQEVDVATAKGEVPLSEALVKSLQTESKMTVAVYKGNPVSVLEYKGDEKEESSPKKP